MTREEAIWWVNHLFEIRKEEYFNKGIIEDAKEVEEAQHMAIEALSQPIVAKHFDIQSGYIYCSPQDAENVKVVVRCKDCKWYMLTDHNDTEVCTNKQWDISMAVYPIISADGFCSYGERKGGAE